MRRSVLASGVRSVIEQLESRTLLSAALAPAAVVASLYPAVTLLLNRTVLRERLHAVHLCGVLAAVFAVACLAR